MIRSPRTLLAVLVGLAGSGLIGLLLLMPIGIGIHGDQVCGNVIVTHVDRWPIEADGDDREWAERACNRVRFSRGVAAGLLALVTVGAVLAIGWGADRGRAAPRE